MRLAFIYWCPLYEHDGRIYCEDVQANAAAALARRLGPVEMVAMVDRSGRRMAAEPFDSQGVTVHPLPYCSSGWEVNVAKAPALVTALRDVFRRRAAQWDGAIIWETPQPNQWARVFCRLAGLPMVLVLAGRPGKGMIEAYRGQPGRGAALHRAYGRWLEFHAQRLTRRLPTLADVDLDRFRPGQAPDWAFYCFGRWREGESLPGAAQRSLEPGQPLRLLTASRLTPVKGLEHLIAAVGLLRGRGAAVCLEIAGEAYQGQYAGYDQRLREQVKALGLDDRISFLGHLGRSQMQAAYNRAHLLVMPAVSHAEGVPKIIPEAMGLGLPVVASHVGSVFRVVADGVNGRLVPPRDPAALADALAGLAAAPDMYANLSRGALAAAPEYTLDRQAVRMADFIRTRITARSRGKVRPAGG